MKILFTGGSSFTGSHGSFESWPPAATRSRPFSVAVPTSTPTSSAAVAWRWSRTPAGRSTAARSAMSGSSA